MENLSQQNRLFSFDSPLGPNTLLVNSFGGTEQLSEIYHFELELVSENFSIDWDQIIDRNVTVLSLIHISGSGGTAKTGIRSCQARFCPPRTVCKRCR